MKTVVTLTIIVISLLLFSKPSFAALTITDVTPAQINSSNDIFIVSVSASSLQSNPQYLQLALTATGQPTNLFGITQNNSGSWYVYKSSPTASDLTSTFYSFNHEGGSWTGQIYGKIDVNDDGYLGPTQYTLRLYKYTISSAGNVSSSYETWASPITINVSSSPTPPSTPTPSPTATPTKTPTPTLTKTSSQTANPTATPTLTSAPTATKTPTKAPSPTPRTEEASVLSENVTVEPTKEQPTPTPQNLPKIFIIGGGLFLLGAGILFYKTHLKEGFDETDSDN